MTETVILALTILIGVLADRTLRVVSIIDRRLDRPGTPRERLERLHQAARGVLEVVDELDSRDPEQRDGLWEVMVDVNRLREMLEYLFDGS